MAWFEKHLRTRRGSEEGRKTLAASLEEMAAQGEFATDDWEAACADDAPAEGTAIIPPRLRLQSRQWPAVRMSTAHTPQAETQEQARAQTKRLGRSTRVHLQAVRVEQEPITERVHVLPASGEAGEQEAAPAGPLLSSQKVAAQETAAAPLRPLNGSGVIEIGQEEVTVACAQVSPRSVVMVMLTGNPGPVVVQYVTLLPRVGFTFHLSAPVHAPTPFNYLFWPCDREA